MPYDTWPCKPKWFFRDDQIPDPDFTLLLEGAYFTLFVGGSTLYGIVTALDSTAGTFYCHLYSDAARTIEITTGDYTAQNYRMEYFAGWTFQNRNRFDERDFSGEGRWVSNPAILYVSGGRFEGNWVIIPYPEASVSLFDGTWVPNNLPIYGITLTEEAGGTLSSGLHTVHVAGVTAGGLIGGASYEQITVAANSKITVDWTPNSDAATYNIYYDCQLRESGVAGPPYTIGDETVESTTPPPKDDDPGIPPDPDAPIIVINPPGPIINPGDPPPGGKIIGTDPDTDTDYTIVVTPGVPIDPNLDGKTIITVTEQVGDCLETKKYIDDELIEWTTFCTDPVSGKQTACEGTKVDAGGVSQIPINLVYPAIPFPMTTVAEQDDIFSFPLGTPNISLTFPVPVVGSITYVDDQFNPIDPDSEGSEGEIYFRHRVTPPSEYLVSDTGPDGWATAPNLEDLEATHTGFELESVTSGDPALQPGSEWYIYLDIPDISWNFLCVPVNAGDVQVPQVGTCRTVHSSTDLFTAGGTPFGTRVTETQCNSNPLYTGWLDLSDLSGILLKLFKLGGPVPRAQIRKPIPRTPRDIHDPRLWISPIGTEDPTSFLELVWLLGRLDVKVPTEIAKRSFIFNRNQLIP